MGCNQPGEDLFTFFGTRRTRPATLRTALTLTALDCRNAPSNLMGTDVSTDPTNEYYLPPIVGTLGVEGQSYSQAGSNTDLPANANKPPVIYITSVVRNAGGTVTISGYVQDENPATLTVSFGSGQIAAINGQSVTTNASGAYSITIDPNGETGEFSAQTTDREGLESNVAYRNIY